MELGYLEPQHPFCKNCPFVDPKTDVLYSGGVPVEVHIYCSHLNLCKEKIKQGMEAHHDSSRF